MIFLTHIKFLNLLILHFDIAFKQNQARRIINEAFKRNKTTQKKQTNKSHYVMDISRPNAISRKKNIPIEYSQANIKTTNLLSAFCLNYS